MTFTDCVVCEKRIYFDENGFTEKAFKINRTEDGKELFVCEGCSKRPMALAEIRTALPKSA